MAHYLKVKEDLKIAKGTTLYQELIYENLKVGA